MTPTPKSMKLKRQNGRYVGRPFSGVSVDIGKKTGNLRGWLVLVKFDNEDADRLISTSTLKRALYLLNEIGDEIVTTRNIQNPEVELPIARRLKGTGCDPATETYHSM